jgi:alpha-beta hydrolase superfamily lysophospholipase
MRTHLGRFLLLSALVYVGLGVALYSVQRNLLYHPTPPAKNSAAPAEALRIDSGDASLQIWRLNPGRERAIIYFGGNAERVLANAAMFTHIFNDATVYLTEYRGFGGSSGEPSEAALYADARAIYDQFADRHAGIAVIGRSLGSGVATYLAAVRTVDRVVLVTPYDSVEAVAAARYPIYPISLMLKDKFPSINYVQEIDSPTLILIAEHDRTIPRKHTDALIAAFGGKELSSVVLQGTQHHTVGESPRYATLLGEFL